MLTIRGESIPQHLQRYETLGDWMGHDNFRQILVSELGNTDYEFLIFVHELIEQALCMKRGITDEMVTAYDRAYEGTSSPGDDLACPYHKEHVYASAVEDSICKELGLDPKEYDKFLDNYCHGEEK